MYNKLLNEGRVWDLYALFQISFYHNDNIEGRLGVLFETSDTCEVLSRVVKDWKMPYYDESTNLALLGILSERMMDLTISGKHVETGIQELSLALAESVVRNDPYNTKSRPFTKWILAKTVLAEAKNANVFQSVRETLSSSKGITIFDPPPPTKALPKYVPVYGENPCWKMKDAQNQFRDIVKLVVNTSRDTHDYKMETCALEQLIRLSSNPEEEFNNLCHLQKNVAGNLLFL